MNLPFGLARRWVRVLPTVIVPPRDWRVQGEADCALSHRQQSLYRSEYIEPVGTPERSVTYKIDLLIRFQRRRPQPIRSRQPESAHPTLWDTGEDTNTTHRLREDSSRVGPRVSQSRGNLGHSDNGFGVRQTTIEHPD